MYFCPPSLTPGNGISKSEIGFYCNIGEVSEWLKEHAWKVCIGETLSRVRIPPSPQTNQSPVRGIFVFTSVESLLSKASGSENDPARSDGFDSFDAPTHGIAEGNPPPARLSKAEKRKC
jgi:hypothetical protein